VDIDLLLAEVTGLVNVLNAKTVELNAKVAELALHVGYMQLAASETDEDRAARGRRFPEGYPV
jgi:hypothetical protein